jgi:hypothetical protein
MVIWPVPLQPSKPAALALGALLLTMAGAAGAQAQQRLAGQCPLIVPKGQQILQPRRIPPGQVAGKNAMGCLSAADAIYGKDGCPIKLCGESSGAFQLPPMNR